MAAVAQLKALLGIDNKAYKAGVRDSERATQRFQRTLATVGKALAGAFSVAAVVRFTKHLVNFASEIRHTADNLGVTTDELQAMNAVALKSGVAIDQVGRALAKTKDAQGNLASGGTDAKRYADALAALGINAERFMRATPAEALAMIGRAYSEAGDKAEGFSAISDILGERIGPRLVSMLKEIGNDGMQTIIDKAKEAGMVLDDSVITKLELAGTRIEQLKLKATILFGELIQRAEAAGKFWGSLFATKNIDQAMSAYKKAIEVPKMPQETIPTAKSGTVNADIIEKANQLRKRYMDRGSAVSGDGISVSSLQRTGGFIGQGRAGVGAVDRRLKLQEKSNEYQKELVKLAKDTNIKIEDLQNALTSGATI